MSEDDVYLEARDGVATIVLNRPAKRNAITYAMWVELAELLARFAKDDALRVLVLRGAGDAAFSAGADISEFQTLRASSEGTKSYDAAAAKAQDALATLVKPSIAMIQGACVGGGCGLALSCDLRFCDTSAKFAITPARLGIVYPVAVTKRLVDLVGAAHAKSILFTGMTIGARRAYEIGLVQDVHEGSLERHVTEYAEAVSSRAQYSVQGTKRVVEMLLGGLTRETEETLALRRAAFDTEDYREGVRAFLEKRKPVFKGTGLGGTT
ncbi:MAG: enoyl-CoA hydratase [Streptosporangiales bacterium]|nr:enoyl-CoA hydratase [Streptosporangiales bacterium]